MPNLAGVEVTKEFNFKRLIKFTLYDKHVVTITNFD